MLGGSDAAVRSGREVISFARKVDDQISDADHFISYYTGDYGQPTWNTRFGLFGRYVVTIQSEIEFDKTRRIIQSYSPPKGYIKEVESIDMNERRIRMVTASQRILDAEQIKAFLSSGCDLRMFGIQPITDDPLNDFDFAL